MVLQSVLQLVLLFFLLLILTTLAAAQVPQPAPVKCLDRPWSTASREGYPPPPTTQRGFDVLAYDLDIEIIPGGSRIAGSVGITLQVVQAALDTIQLDLVEELTCLEVNGAGGAVPFARQEDALFILPATTPALGDTLRVSVRWAGQPPRHGEMQVGLLFRHHNAGTPEDPTDDVPIVANISEPWSAHSWWPCKDHPADKAAVTMAVTVPEDLVAISNGTLLGSEPVAPDRVRYRWSEAYPLPTYLVSVAVSNYESWSEDCLGVPLEYHVFPPDREHAEHDFAPTCDMLEFMTDLAGPYPFAGEKYAQVEIKWIGAMEHATATSISQFTLSGDGTYETLILHELSHHWFGNSLTPGRWRDLWLNEGFARYCEALWVEHSRGAEAYRDFMHSIGRQRHPEWFAGDGLLGDPAPILPNLMVYNKGAWLLHSLRQILGDEAFFALLRDYAGDPELVHGTVLREDFIAAAGRAAGRDLGGFFAPWLETESVPEVWWQARYFPDRVELEVGQNQDAIHELTLPVEVQTTCGHLEEMVTLRERRNTFTLPTACPPTGLLVDPDSLVFMFRALGSGSQPVARRPLQVAGPLPNPLPRRGGDFLLYLDEPMAVRARVYDLRGRLVRQYDLGLVEETGLLADKLARPHRWHLDLPAAGRPLPAGIYWLEMLGERGRDVRKFTVID